MLSRVTSAAIRTDKGGTGTASSLQGSLAQSSGARTGGATSRRAGWQLTPKRQGFSFALHVQAQKPKVMVKEWGHTSSWVLVKFKHIHTRKTSYDIRYFNFKFRSYKLTLDKPALEIQDHFWAVSGNQPLEQFLHGTPWRCLSSYLIGEKKLAFWPKIKIPVVNFSKAHIFWLTIRNCVSLQGFFCFAQGLAFLF